MEITSNSSVHKVSFRDTFIIRYLNHLSQVLAHVLALFLHEIIFRMLLKTSEKLKINEIK